MLNEDAGKIYEAWVRTRVEYEDATDPIEKGLLAAESAILLQMYIQATDN